MSTDSPPGPPPPPTGPNIPGARSGQELEDRQKELSVIQQIEQSKRVQDALDKQSLDTLKKREQLAERLFLNTQSINQELEKQKALELEIQTAKQNLANASAENVDAAIKALEKQEKALAKSKNTLKDFSDILGVSVEKMEEMANGAGNFSDLAKKGLQDVKDEIKMVEQGSKGAEGVLQNAFKDSRGIIGTLITDGIRLKKSFADVAKKINELPDTHRFLGPVKNFLTTVRIDKLLASISSISIVAIAGVLGLAMAFKKVFDKLMEATAAAQQMAAAGGDMAQLRGELMETAKIGAGFGLTMEETVESMNAMKALSSFKYGDSVNKETALLIGSLKKLGVETATSVKSIQFFEQALGKTRQEAGELTNKLAMMGRELGIDSKVMIDGFIGVSDRFAMYGDKAIETYGKLQSVIKGTGIEASRLLDISKKFDTFADAASAVSKMNAIVGTQLSTIDMMQMDDADRIVAIRNEVKASLGSMDFSELNKFEQLAITEAMGLSSVEEAMKLINMSDAEYVSRNKEMEQRAATQQEINETLQQLVPLGDKIKLSMSQLLLALAPFISMLSYVLDIIPELTYGLMGLVVIIAALAVVTGGWSAILTAMGWTLLVSAITLVVWGLGWLIKKLFGLDKVLHKKGSPELWKLPAAMAEGFMFMKDVLIMVGKAFFWPIFGLKKLWEIFHKPGSPLLWLLPLFFGKNFQEMGEMIGDTIGQITRFVEALTEFSKIEMKGFVAISSDGENTSLLAGSENIITSLSEGKLTIDVKIPEFNIPKSDVKVYIGDKELTKIVKDVNHEQWAK